MILAAGCVPVFIGPPWHAMPYPEVVDYKAAAVSIHFADTSKWANFGSKWVLEKNTPRDTSRMHPRWWTPQVPPTHHPCFAWKVVCTAIAALICRRTLRVYILEFRVYARLRPNQGGKCTSDARAMNSLGCLAAAGSPPQQGLHFA